MPVPVQPAKWRFRSAATAAEGYPCRFWKKKEVFRLKIRLDLPHEMVKQIDRSVKMNIFAPHHCGGKPFHLITA